MERIITILIIESNCDTADQLKKILIGQGNNLIFCKNKEAAIPILKSRNIGIILLGIQYQSNYGLELLQELSTAYYAKNAYKIIITDSSSSASRLVKGIKKGAVGYITSPFEKDLIKAKIEVFKSLYFKDLRINQLLENIFPIRVLSDLENNGKFSPKKIEKGIVLFTDFIAFTRLSKYYKPLELVQELESYFSAFDTIIKRYDLEKIKTIGDAYMALGGVTENNPLPAVRATLAALEIRNYMIQRKKESSSPDEAWDIRIGLHAGPLVAGIIGTKKISFDVWGDTVNIASRAEQNSTLNNITITDSVARSILPYFSIKHRGKIKVKHGGFVDMYFVEALQLNYSLFNNGELPNSTLRLQCGLTPMDFDSARQFILMKLDNELNKNLVYHSIMHTLNVEKAAIRIAHFEGVQGESLILLRTAVLFHDSGFLVCYDKNEEHGVQLAKKILPDFGYNEQQIQTIATIIQATKRLKPPSSILEEIMCDADHDYIGRPDYQIIANKLREELVEYKNSMTDLEWVNFQLEYLENVHVYYTSTSKNIRGNGKLKRISELKKQLKRIPKS